MAGIRVASLFCVLLCFGLAQSETFHWTGTSGTDQFWSNPANWDIVRVPTAADDVIIMTGIPLIRDPAVCNSLKLLGNAVLSVLPTSVVIGMGGVIITQTATLRFQGGGDPVLRCNGVGNIMSTNGFDFQSGNLAGNWVIWPNSTMSFNTPALKQFQGTRLINQGKISTRGAPIFLNSSTSFVNTGTLYLTGGTLILSLDSTSYLQCNGTCRVDPDFSNPPSPVTIRCQTDFSPLNVSANARLLYNDGVYNRLSRVTVEEGATVANEAGGAVTIADISGPGQIVAKTLMTISGKVSVGNLVVSTPGNVPVFFKDAVDAFIKTATLDTGGIMVADNSNLVVSQFNVLGGGFLSGGSMSFTTLNVGPRSTQNTMLWNTSLQATTTTVGNTSQQWNFESGSFMVPVGGRMTLQTKVSVANTGGQYAKPIIRNDGQVDLAFTDSNTVWELIGVSLLGRGSYNVATGKLLVRAANWTGHAVAFQSDTATVEGQAIVMNIDTVTAPPTKELALHLDAATVRCGPVCQEVHTVQPASEFCVEVYGPGPSRCAEF